MDKYKNKYRIPSARLQNWDYGSNAAYFVTICTKHRLHYFGEIVPTPDIAAPLKMQLSEIGELANKFWLEIPQHFPFVKLGAYVIMPNHVHGIIVLETPKLGVSAPNNDTTPNDITKTTRTANASKKWKPATLGVIMNQYKRICTINARQIHADFAWQSRFHDHIIRNQKSFETISRYIENNVLNWCNDKFK